MSVRGTCLSFAVVLLTSGQAFAHDFWLEHHAGAFLLRYGHRGEKALALDGGKVRTLRCRPERGAAEDLRRKAVVSPTQVSVSASCAVLSAFLDGGFWSLTPDGEKNLPKNKVPDAVKAWRSKQFAKWVDSRSPLAGQAQGDELEIVPVSDLAKVRTGDKATFRVLLGGQAVAGAVLSMGHKPLGETDDRGEVRVRIRATEVESVSVSYRRAVKSPEADSEVFEASLTFEVAR
jgi:uncharacterized GH25 family protein